MEAPILQLGAAGFPQTEPICPQNALFCPKSGSLMPSAPLAVLCAACSPFPCSLFSLPPHPRGAQPQNAAFLHPSADFRPQNGAFQAQNGSFVHPAAPARSLSAPEWKLCLLHCPPPISAAFVCSPKFPLFHPKTALPLPFPFPVSHRNPCWPTEALFCPQIALRFADLQPGSVSILHPKPQTSHFWLFCSILAFLDPNCSIPRSSQLWAEAPGRRFFL